jgi:hypothetical protein
MNEWNIQSRSHACQSCETPFADKQVYQTLLLDAKTEFQRLDICEPCWASRYSKTAAETNLISRWQGVYETPPPAPPEAIQRETAETLLRKLVEDNDPKHGAACFILAVMLERKRLLKVKEQVKREDGTRIFVYEHPRTGDVFTIADPNLRLDQLEEVQRDVGQLLEHGLNPPPPPPEIISPINPDNLAGEASAEPAETVATK